MLAHFLDHEIRRTYRIVGNAAGLDDRIHLLVGLIQVIDNLDSGLFFELINDGFINVLAPVVNVEFIVFVGTGLGRAAAGHRYRSSKDCQSSHGNASVRFFHVNILLHVNKR